MSGGASDSESSYSIWSLNAASKVPDVAQRLFYGGRKMKFVLIAVLWVLAMVSIAFAIELGIVAAWKYIQKKEGKDD